MRVAAIDVGTNTVRLLVADLSEQTAVIERDSRITRLGEGVDASGTLAPEPMRRTLEVVCEFAGRAGDAGADRILVAGTSALRDAGNRANFAGGLWDRCGVKIEILDGAVEGRVAYTGATSWLDDGRYVVCDIGGGSTELITAESAVSADVGSVRLRERLLPGDPPSPADVEKARDAVIPQLEAARDGLKLAGDEELVGVAGTITTLGALDAGLSSYDGDVVHGYRLSAEAIERWAERLNGMTVQGIKELGPVHPGRADVIGAGALVLSCVVGVLGSEALVVSERDILDGLVLRAVG